MPKNNYSDQRRKAATSLRALGSILNRSGVCADIGPISTAAEQCSRGAPHGPNSWGYDIANLVFRMDVPGNTVPLQTKDFRVELSISVAGKYDEDEDDQFVSLEMNLEKYAYSAQGVELKSAWHFDRHIIDTKKDDPHVTEDIHPLYHFQYGGARMYSLDGQLGTTLLLDPPRLMHPPMDGVLAIDFVLANYAGGVWKALRMDHQYANLVLPQFKQFWQPYFSSVAAGWIQPRVGRGEFLCPFF